MTTFTLLLRPYKSHGGVVGTNGVVTGIALDGHTQAPPLIDDSGGTVQCALAVHVCVVVVVTYFGLRVSALISTGIIAPVLSEKG